MAADENPWAKLNEWVAGLAELSRGRRNQLIAELLEDDARVGGIAAAAAMQPDRWSAWLTRHEKALTAAHTGTLRRTVAARLKQVSKHVLLADALGRDDLPAVRVPTEYVVKPDGIWRIERTHPSVEPHERRISYRPLIAAAVLEDVDDGSRTLRLEWLDGSWRSVLVPPSFVQDRRTFVTLSDRGAPVSNAWAADLAKFIHDFVEVNAEVLPRTRSIRRLGFPTPDGSSGFMWGRTQLLAEDGHAVSPPPGPRATAHVHLDIPPDDGRAELVAGHRASGTFDGWREAIYEVLPYCDRSAKPGGAGSPRVRRGGHDRRTATQPCCRAPRGPACRPRA